MSVGTEPHRSNNRSAGVATTGVALQGPAEGAQQDAGKRVATIGVALKEAVCKRGSSSVQEDGCKGGSVQDASTCRNMRSEG